MAVLEKDFELSFNNFDMQSIPYLLWTKRLTNGDTDERISSKKPINFPGEVPVGKETGTKVLAYEGFIVAPTRVDMETSLDILKARIRGVNRPLVFEQAGSQRIYTATKENLVEEPLGAGHMRLNLAFRCYQPYGRSSNVTIYTENVTDAIKELDHDFLGYAPVRPVGVFTITDLTDGTAKKVRISNSITGQGIAVTRDWVDGEVLRVDFKRLSVFVDDVEVDYTGIFPDFVPGQHKLVWSDEFDDRDVDVQLEYDKQYY